MMLRDWTITPDPVLLLSTDFLHWATGMLFWVQPKRTPASRPEWKMCHGMVAPETRAFALSPCAALLLLAVLSTAHASVCRPPYEPENGGYTCHPSPCHRLTHGTVIEYFCDEGYALKGDYKYLTCEDGEWDSPMQISCHLSQGKEPHSPLGVPALSIVASTASSVALILLLIVLFVLLQPKLKSFHHSRREQGVPGQPVSIVVEGVQVSLPSYEEAVYGSGGGAVAPSESRVPSSSSSSSSSSSPSWASEQPCAAGPRPQRRDSESSDQHSLLSLTSAEEFADDIPLLKEA
ncbi:hypothetical protein ANANG_G00119530 [Anguilla anguilla]|uniref:Sushi domain-containing protein n=1 Tax=Anguilla anguilla TaxID=7936 RepID=A0A9D3S1G9_ANGAN|nr:hypothetical protein ANANG_G00119530 [Anguilla anguilla]